MYEYYPVWHQFGGGFRVLTFWTPILLVGRRRLGWDSYLLPKQVIARHSTIICRKLHSPNESETG